MSTQPSSTPITAEGAVSILRAALEKIVKGFGIEQSKIAIAALAATESAAIQPAGPNAVAYDVLSHIVATTTDPHTADFANENRDQFFCAPQDAKAEQAKTGCASGSYPNCDCDELGGICLAARPDNLFTNPSKTGQSLYEEGSKLSIQSAPIEAEELPELLPLPKPLKTTERGTPVFFVGQMLDYARAYGQLCRDTARPASSVTSARDSVLEEAAEICDSLGGDIDMRDPDETRLCANSLAHAIRALKTVQGKASDAEDGYPTEDKVTGKAHAMYRTHVNSSGIHENRFPAWGELSVDEQAGWKHQARSALIAARAQQQGGSNV